MSMEARWKALEAERDGAYSERNQLVAWLASMFPSALCETDIPGWEPEWRWCVYLMTPAGQMSWHIHERELPLFDHVEREAWEWDGHTTEEKYQRIRSLIPTEQENSDES